MEKAFDFGKNWASFSEHCITGEALDSAKKDFRALLEGIELKGKSFLDIGSGQGLPLLIAKSEGARVVGCDINPLCAEVTKANRRHFLGLEESEIPFVTGSILDANTVEQIKALAPSGGFDIVYSWGVLHHTGDMQKAIATAASLVRPGGHLVLAIYNRHWSSGMWLCVKRLYNASPRFFQKALVLGFYPLMLAGAWACIGRNPLVNRKRGMDFYHDVVDWVGGLPYEYASAQELRRAVEPLGFKLLKAKPTSVLVGNNELVFQKL